MLVYVHPAWLPKEYALTACWLTDLGFAQQGMICPDGGFLIRHGRKLSPLRGSMEVVFRKDEVVLTGTIEDGGLTGPLVSSGVR